MEFTPPGRSNHPVLRVRDLLRDPRLGLEVVAGESGLGHKIASDHPQKPGLALAGHLEHLNPRKIQVLGQTEVSFLGRLPDEALVRLAEDLRAKGPVCFVTTKNLQPPEVFLRHLGEAGVPFLRTGETTLTFIKKLIASLEELLSPQTSVHGVLVSVLGIGLLLVGKSGIGKSECALDLVDKGHRLVADDLVFLRRTGEGDLLGFGSEEVRHHMEIRGLGIIDVKALFGLVSVVDAAEVSLVMELVAWNEEHAYDRLGLEEDRVEILGVSVPHITIPVSPGRNLAVIVEVAARNHLLKKTGHHAPRELERLINRKIEASAGGGAGGGT
jgi:HPr kinase/phosphorylase